METAYKAHLEAKIQSWASEHCEDINFWWPPDFVRKMTDAVEVVFDAAQSAQSFGIEEEKD